MEDGELGPQGEPALGGVEDQAAGALHAEEGTSTVPQQVADAEGDVISSYTSQDAADQAAIAQHDAAVAAAADGDAADASQAGSGSMAEVPETTAAAGSRPGSGAAAAAGAGPPSPTLVGPPSSSSRPASARPMSARPGSQHGSRSGSQQGSRPGSQQGPRPGSGSLVIRSDSQQQQVEDGLGGTSSPQQGSTPGSGGGASPGSRPMSGMMRTPPTIHEESEHIPHTSQSPLEVTGSRPASSSSRASAQQQQQQQSAAPSPPPAAVIHSQSQSGRPASAGQHAPPAQPPGAVAGAAAAAAYSAKVAAAEAAGYIAPGLRLIDVQVEQGPGLPNRMLRVLMDYTQSDSKPYLGGFRNKRSGAVYHHAVTQTPRAPKYAGVEPKLERQTQTVKESTRSQQTMREAGTQMERPGVVVDTTHDRVKTPGRYQTSEERLAIVTAATRMIQRWWRGYQGRKRAAYLRGKKAEREAFLREEEAKALQAAEEHRRKEIERRMHPRTAADFEILYNELEAWRLQETKKIKEAGLDRDREQEVLAQLLHKETKLLQTIDRLKINANHENKDLRIQHTLGKMSQPKKYELKNGKKVEVHTPFTTRAKELMQLYNGLNLPLLTIDERLDVLLHVKWTVKEFDCNLTREIVELIDREADLLNRGRSPKMLEGLRKRISSLFLTFIETPEFNPEAASYQVVPMDFEHYLFSKLDKSSPRATVVTASTNSRWE